MELKLIALSLACSSLFMQPALSSLPTVKGADSNGIKGVPLSDAELALKETEALPAAQGPTKLTHTDAAINGIGPDSVALNANLGVVMLQRPVYYPTFPINTVVAAPCPNIFDILSGVWRAVRNKVAIAGQVLHNMICPPVVQYISRPNHYPMPVVGCFNQFKRK